MMDKQLELGDVCASKHGHDPNSDEAYRLMEPSKPRQQERVLAAIKVSGERGLSCKELAENWGVGSNAISGRFTELYAAGKVARVDRRRGAWVYWVVETEL